MARTADRKRTGKHTSANGASDGRAERPMPNGLTRPASAGQQTQRVKVIKFSNVSKRFILHHERPQSFQDMVVSLFGLRTPSKRGLAMPRPANEEFWAVRDVNFGIYAGEAVGIIGENGSGKSTTLKLVTKILEPTSGSVSVRGKVSALLELGTGFHPELTGRENIFLNGSLLGISRKSMAERYDQIVDFAELQEFIDTPIKHYSSGMVMRLGFAVAINVDPDILLTDEVLAVGDEAFQRKCLDYISALRRRGVTIVYVSHALDSVRGLCQRAIWLDHGRLIADGPSGEVIDRYLAYENEKHAERLRSGGDLTAVAERVARPVPDARSTDQDDDFDTEIANVSESGQLARSDAPLGEQDEATEVAEPSFDYDAIGSHWSTGDVQVTGVTFLDGQGKEAEVFSTGEPFTIRIHYDAPRRLDNPVFGLALYTQNGVQLNGPNTRFSGAEIPYISGKGYVDYHIDSLPLLTGRYDVTVAVTGSELTDLLDHQHRAYSFYVQPTPGLPERWGLVYIPAEWSFHADGDTTSDG
jgi:ABC-type polysaccharide/polyol phosphate transport system ATPase subunit